MFEFDGGWKVKGAKSPSNNSNTPSVDAKYKFLIEAGVSPSLVSMILPKSGNIRGVWGDVDGRFFMTGYESPVSIDATNPEATKKANQEQFEKLKLN
jgi:hypothetical protein